MAATNPRYPHWCRIIRKTVEDPLEDEDDFTPLDSDIADSSQSTVIYEGMCRSYAKNTTSDRGEVIVSSRGLALPLRQDDWVSRGECPMEGDEVVIDHGAFQEYGSIIDKIVATANYAGTHLIWKYGRT